MQNVTKLQEDSSVLRERTCRWAKEGTTPFGTTSKALQSQDILALDTGAPLHHSGELGKEAKMWLQMGVAPAPPGRHHSPETRLAASLGPCTAGMQFLSACQGSGCQAVVLG